jgi:nucleotide-binding universal stress UspA family protein
MIALKKILVPTDFSETSEVALRYGKALAETFGGTLHLLHVLPDPLAQPWGPEAYGVSIPDITAEMKRSALERLAALVPQAERGRVDVESGIQVGSPFVEILRHAQDRAIDLIVMGTHGRGPVAHMLMGSVAEKVVRSAPCPVLTVRHPQHQFVMP